MRHLLVPLILAALALAPMAGIGVARASTRAAEPYLLIAVGVPETLREEVNRLLPVLLEDAAYAHRIVGLAELERELLALHEEARAVALGRDACERLGPSGVPTLCALLSAEAFAAVDCATHCEELRAIVMDQPVSRQVAVAAGVYPALGRFGVIGRSRPADEGRLADDLALLYREFAPRVPLPAQLDAALEGSDALVALPDSTIFNRSTLHVVLLTAYGYAKPVIGFSRAYVRAGALISAYATPEQVLRDVFEETGPSGDITAARESWFDDDRVRPSMRFSVAENRRIARSLGLLERVRIESGRDYRDEDFRP